MSTQRSSETSPHDWASPEYVQYWAERSDREAGERRYRFNLMADLVPHPEDAPIAILDMGAGYGAVTGVMLEHFPAARATCLDGSEAMLELLGSRQARFKDRITTVFADYSQPDWAERLSGATFDAVVSSQGMHSQRERRRNLYREVFAVLKPGGCFLNVDLVAPSTQHLGDRFRYVEIRRRITRRAQATGRRPSFEEVAAEVDGRRPDGTPALASRQRGGGDWTDDMLWLREAGFVDVDCFWKELRVCLIGGYRE